MRLHRLIWLFVALTMVGAVSAQTFYKWTDAAGVTHYSEQRPPTVKAQPLHLRSAGAAPAPASTAAEPSTAADLDAAERDFRKQACATARDNLRLLSSSAMVLDTGTVQHPGDITTASKLSTEQRAAATATAHKQIDQYCARG